MNGVLYNVENWMLRHNLVMAIFAIAIGFLLSLVLTYPLWSIMLS